MGVLDSNVQCLYSEKDGIPSSSKRNCWVVCFLEEKWMIALDTKKLGSKIRTKIAVAKQINHGEVKQLLWRLPRITSHCEIEHKTLENSVPRIQWHMTSIQIAKFWALRVR